ncbi:allantoate amidohydrolase [Nocardioides jishulii]|uniref:Allantoate amidohydrolase n=1 Tax=Nocardioides jishulii TaxID=2575440 RepID=A0A4U2YT80_9ACTN|nr:allantoate amidohydrolase [Nocardioides jishulii]QCX26344.1 allantoate amidohydrolase [Nocardioides jishulii]TKI63852.1 allantoate amidohydrolase [Nocardioides jishulii]
MTFEGMWKELEPLGRAAHGGYFRQPFTSVDAELRDWFRGAARQREMTVEEDAFGNLVAWWGGVATAEVPGLLTGSHLDSVLDGGAYDGPLGVVSGFAAVDLLAERGVTPSRPVGVAAFAEEEGSRFGVACLGSRLATGAWSWEEARELRDRDGVWLGDAMATVLSSPGPGRSGARRESWVARVATFVELHVEQGRDLVERGASVGLGSGIWPHGRYRFDFTGEANHAGSTRMEDRHDPMLTYAMTALAANKQARLGGHRATFGRLEVSPNGTNAVPSRVTAWLDARAASSAGLDDLVATVRAQAEQRAGRDGTSLTVTAESTSAAVAFDAALVDVLGEGRGWPVIPTAAGHDAGVLAQAGVPTAMLFVRNPTGVSHSPDEHAETEDCLAGVEALADVLARLLA